MTDQPKLPFNPALSSPAFEAARRLQNSVAAQQEEWQRSIAAAKSAGEEKWAREQAAVDRDVESLDLTARLVDLQAQMVEKQDEILKMQQASEAEQGNARRRELIMIWISAVALVVAIVGVLVTVA